MDFKIEVDTTSILFTTTITSHVDRWFGMLICHRGILRVIVAPMKQTPTTIAAPDSIQILHQGIIRVLPHREHLYLYFIQPFAKTPVGLIISVTSNTHPHYDPDTFRTLGMSNFQGRRMFLKRQMSHLVGQLILK